MNTIFPVSLHHMPYFKVFTLVLCKKSILAFKREAYARKLDALTLKAYNVSINTI